MRILRFHAPMETVVSRAKKEDEREKNKGEFFKMKPTVHTVFTCVNLRNDRENVFSFRLIPSTGYMNIQGKKKWHEKIVCICGKTEKFEFDRGRMSLPSRC